MKIHPCPVLVNQLDAASTLAKAVSVAAGNTTVGAGIRALEQIVGLKQL